MKLQYGMVRGPRNRVSDGRAHQCHLLNTVERSCTAAISGSTRVLQRGLFFNYLLRKYHYAIC